jgi:hypothetical protein
VPTLRQLSSLPTGIEKINYFCLHPNQHSPSFLFGLRQRPENKKLSTGGLYRIAVAGEPFTSPSTVKHKTTFINVITSALSSLHRVKALPREFMHNLNAFAGRSV